MFIDEIEAEEEHEKGTVQSFFDMKKIEEFIKDTNFEIKWCEKHVTQNMINETHHRRYYLVLEKRNGLV